ncbi:MAG: tetratricopeptide repeat protein [Hyphomicrobiales bacterium]|nr:tetratricopeptide repeat protein [Hyphomicrobiales bacterium]
MRCPIIGIFALSALLLTSLPAQAQRAKEWEYCDESGHGTPDERISNCTVLIESPVGDGDRAVAYNNRGVAWDDKGDQGLAIADYDQAIRLKPNYTRAYYNRGNAYSERDATGDEERAIADYDRAIGLDPKFTFARINRGNALRAKGDTDRALADYDEAIGLDPKLAKTYAHRGITNLSVGALTKALADFKDASELDPENSYMALWRDILNRRSNLPSQLAGAAKNIDMTLWPAPVVRLYLGELAPEAVLSAANDPDPQIKRGQVCDAHFYTGELALQQGNKDEALRLFHLATDCPKSFIEYEGAIAELKALGVTP